MLNCMVNVGHVHAFLAKDWPVDKLDLPEHLFMFTYM